MKSSTFKTIVLVFGLTVCMSNSSFAQSQDRQQKTPPTFSELILKKWMPMRMGNFQKRNLKDL